MRLASLLALAGAVLGLTAAGCGGTESVAPLPQLENFTEVAHRSAQAQTGRFSFAMEMSFPGADKPLAFSGEGAFDSAADRSSFSMDMSAVVELLGGLAQAVGGEGELGDPDNWRIDAVQYGNLVYMRFPMLDEQLPAGKTWILVDPTSMPQMQGIDLEQLRNLSGGTDPRDSLKFLEAVTSGIETVGSEDVRGAQTTHYRGVIDFARFAKLFPAEQQEQASSLFGSLAQQAGMSTMPVDVWVDADGQVRKMVMAMSATQPGTSQSMDATISFELYDYGKDVSIEAPPADQVVDASALRSLHP